MLLTGKCNYKLEYRVDWVGVKIDLPFSAPDLSRIIDPLVIQQGITDPWVVLLVHLLVVHRFHVHHHRRLGVQI